MKILALLVLSACVTEIDDVALSTDSSEILSSNRIASNGLILDRTLLGKVASGSLATVVTRAPALLTTADGRELFSYLVGCALKPTSSITLPVGGVATTFAGSVGLAPNWAVTSPTKIEQKWISACMLARTNLFGISVPISVRGLTLSTPSSERDAFTLVEGAFWGDIFTPGAAIYACEGPLKLAGSTLSTLPQRECAMPSTGGVTKCNFTYAGPCASVCVQGSTSYQLCTGAAEVLTVYVAKP